MDFETWWRNHLVQIETLRKPDNLEYLKVCFENCWNFSRENTAVELAIKCIPDSQDSV